MSIYSNLKYKRRLTIVATLFLPDYKGRPSGLSLRLNPGDTLRQVMLPHPGIYKISMSARVDLADPWAELWKMNDLTLKMMGLKKRPEFPFYSEASAHWKLLIKEDLSVEILGKAKILQKKSKLYKSEGIKIGLGIPFFKGSSLSFDIIDQADITQTVAITANHSRSAVSLTVLAKHDKRVLLNETMRMLFEVAKPKKKDLPKPKKLSFKKKSFVIGPFVTDSDNTNKMDKKAKKVPGAIDGHKLTKEINALSVATREMYQSGNRPPGFSNIKIKGFADTRDTKEKNRDLGLKRAKAVMKHIQADLGASDAYFSALTKGEGPKPNKDGEKGEDNPKARIVTVEMLIVK